MSVFWAINAAYQIVIPFPVPRSMQAVRWSLLAFPIIVAVCYGAAYVAASSFRRARTLGEAQRSARDEVGERGAVH